MNIFVIHEHVVTKKISPAKYLKVELCKPDPDHHLFLLFYQNTDMLIFCVYCLCL